MNKNDFNKFKNTSIAYNLQNYRRRNKWTYFKFIYYKV